MGLQGILFDLDGTIINTNELIFQSLEYALDTVLHQKVSREILRTTFGLPLQQIMQDFGGEQAQELRDAFVQYSHAHENHIFLFPYVVETLQQLKDMHIKTAIVTSRLRQSALRDLNQFDLVSYFDAIITPERSVHHKPHPEPAQKAMEQLQLLPEQTIMVGDSHLDLQCGKQAGCQTAAVRYSVFPLEELLHYQPNYVLNHLQELIPILQQNFSLS